MNLNNDKEKLLCDSKNKSDTLSVDNNCGKIDSKLNNVKSDCLKKEQDFIFMKSELDKYKEESSKNLDSLLRARAEIENVKKRNKKDIDNAYKYSIYFFAKEILSVVDSLEKGLCENKKKFKDNDNLCIYEGMDLTYKLLMDILDKFSIKSINALGKKFDPYLHESISTVDVKDKTKFSGEVFSVIQKGYTHHDRVLRHSKVVVINKVITSV